MRIDEITERKIKDAASIVDVVGDFVELKPQGSGARYVGLCPFHDDRHATNFSVYPRKNVFKCFACDAKGGPVEFVMKHENLDYPDALRWLAKKYGIYVEGAEQFKPKPSPPRPPRPPEEPKELRYWPQEWVKRYKADDSDQLVSWIKSIPWGIEQRARIEQVLNNYCIGHSRFSDEYGRQHDFTIFWMIDHDGRVCNGHLMKYRCDGHRVKDKNLYPTTWIHARMRKAKKNPFDDDKQQECYCLFGEHLLNLAPHAIINIVESEKTAILMAIAYGNPRNNIWMACAGLSNLTNEHKLLRPLIEQGRRIALYPDRDGVEAWRKAAREINYKHLTLQTDPVLKWWIESDGPKADVADIVLRMIIDGSRKKITPAERLRRMEERNPAIGQIIEGMDLKLKTD